MNLVLFGPPGSGKGTQSLLLAERRGFMHLSTGEALRAAVKARTRAGIEAQAIMERGELVPDDVVTRILADFVGEYRRKTQRFLFDGYPRTVPQVFLLDKLLADYKLASPYLLCIDVPEETLLPRLTGRRICVKCKAMYNIHFSPSKVEGVCDVCGGHTQQRNDDREETIRERLRVYREQCLPVMEEYRQRGRLQTVSGVGTMEEVFTRVDTAITAVPD